LKGKKREVGDHAYILELERRTKKKSILSFSGTGGSTKKKLITSREYASLHR